MNPESKNLQVSDLTEMGRLVARALEQADTMGQGEHLAQASAMMSWQGLVDILNAQGHNFAAQAGSK